MGTWAKVVAALLLASALPVCAIEIVVDNDGGAPGFVTNGDWTLSTSTGYNGTTYVFTEFIRPPSYCVWTATIPVADRYEVYAVFRRGSNRPPDAPHTITHADGTTVVPLDQRGSGVSEGLLGEFQFNAGTATVRMDNNGSNGAYIADAIIFRTAVDNPPVIANVQRAPGSPTASDPVIVTATITDDRGPVTASLFYQIGATPYTSVAMYDDGAHSDGAAGDDVFGGTIPAQPTNTLVNYYVRAIDNASLVSNSLTYNYTVGQTAPPEWRCIWADSWGTSFLNATQANDLINTCRSNNINTIMVEVRKIGDAYYNSSLEPRATNISGGASFDPLGYLLQQAHDTSGGKKRINVHAWFVMHRITTGETLSPQHVLMQHPEYEMFKSDGTNITTRYLDPGHPGTVNHNINVILDCMNNYDVDGVNLDYIRYPEYTGSWGYNPTSIQRFNTVYGKTGNPVTTDPDWANWRRECVSLEVRKLYVKMWKAEPQTVLTACTVNWGYNYNTFTSSDAYARVYQDWVGWLRAPNFDYNALMNYATDNTRYNGWTNRSLIEDDKRGSIIGIGAYLQSTIQNSMNQLLYARQQGAAGLNIYDWYSEVNGSSSGETRTQFYSALKSQVFPTWADAPASTWKTAPAFGIFEGTITDNGTPVDHATVQVVGQPLLSTVSDGSGWFGVLEVPPGNHVLRFTKAGKPDLLVNATIGAAGDIVTVNADFQNAGVVDWQYY